MEYFKRGTPESVGIASGGIRDFRKDLERKGIEMHSLMVIRHGVCCAQGWWAPYGPDFLHPLFSFSKTLTATAVGFAWQEGLLDLQERVVDLFPQEAPEEPSENLKKMTVHHLLTMSCGHETECLRTPAGLRRTADWIHTFLHHPVPYEPGTHYLYNTMGTHLLAAVILRKTGMQVTEYLRPRLFQPLGIERVSCDRMIDPDRVEMGGSGMKLATEDMARFLYFLLGRGKWEGKQLLREEWFDMACSKQIETAGDAEGHIKDWAHGYGYQCWMCALPGSYRADGAYGQFGFVFPTLDLIVVSTMATEQTQAAIDSLMGCLIPAVGKALTAEKTARETLASEMDHLALPALWGGRSGARERLLEDCCYVSTGSCSSMERLTGGAGLVEVEEGELERMWFCFETDAVVWNVWENGGQKSIRAALDNRFSYCECGGHLYAATARFRSKDALEMEIRRMDAISGVRLLFRFAGEELYLEADDTLISTGGMGLMERMLCPFVRQV